MKLGRSFSLDPAPFLKEVKFGPKVIFLCNPNNPTGALAPREDLLEIIEGALKEDALVFLDEDFIDFVEDGASLVGEVEDYRNLFVLRSFTKAYGLAGLRVGYVAACKEAAGLLAKAKTPWNVNCLAQAAALAALNDESYLERTRRFVEAERSFLAGELKRLKALKVFPSSANFIFVDVRRAGLTAAQLKEEMLKRGILIRDCSSFRGLDEFYVRVAVRTREENERLLEALREVVEGRA
ncbi:TPA: aminotransferase class I/II-fold pyridoxal phosphate-dependent enzyme [Candidatus Bathyarchaeota archaeon]|nr:aminotransferase class I/II-fold pyridoxal phosphate-dependent enzyme [Candidatus Bathyarchaeota archaeon]